MAARRERERVREERATQRHLLSSTKPAAAAANEPNLSAKEPNRSANEPNILAKEPQSSARTRVSARHTLPHTATHGNTLPHTATHSNTLQHTANGVDRRSSPEAQHSCSITYHADSWRDSTGGRGGRGGGGDVARGGGCALFANEDAENINSNAYRVVGGYSTGNELQSRTSHKKMWDC